MDQELNYYQIINHLPKSISGLFVGIPSWVENRIFEESSRGRILARTKELGVQKQFLENLKLHKDRLSIIMFIYFLDRFFVRTYKMTKEAMDLLSELGIDALQIGNTVFEKDNKNVMMGKLLHEELLSLFANDKILNEFLQYEKAYEVIDEYMERYSNVDLCF